MQNISKAIRELSQEEKAARAEFREARKLDSEFLKLTQDKEWKVMTFNPKVTPTRDVSERYDGKISYIYDEITEVENSTGDEIDPDRVWKFRATKATADSIEEKLDQGYTVLKLTRYGKPKDTRTIYVVDGVR
jgi:hypothetical protein